MPKQQEIQFPTVSVPLAEIRLENFKSVTDATVELRPLSVVVGRNSSGKSTLLQSVLALAQAVRNRSNSSEFPLNGEYVRLGTFSEVLSFQSTRIDPEISIGFSITADSRAKRQRKNKSSDTSGDRKYISWSGHLAAPQEKSNGFAKLKSFEFGISTVGGSVDSSRVSLDISTVNEELDDESPAPITLDWRSVRPNSSFLQVQGRIIDMAVGKSSRVDNLAISGGLPTAAFRQESRLAVYARNWWDAYRDLLSELIAEQEKLIAERVSEGKTAKKINKAVEAAFSDLNDVFEFENNPQKRAEDEMGEILFNAGLFHYRRYFETKLVRLSDKQRETLAASMASLGEAEFTSRLSVAMSKVSWADEVILEDLAGEIGGELWAATRSAEILFRDLQYLGPLRESPQVLYNPGPSRIDLGTKGEYTAAVLHAHQNRKYMVPLPDGSVRNTRLGEALNLWLVKLGLADEAKATDRGRLGIGLTVSPVGSGKDVDLTSVGVGVSQVLPVLLLCLLARRGSVVLMEQPELHLHPAMQLRLADFLLACAKSGRQIIIETHSEHLVNRLRFHVAQDETNATSDYVQLLFAEQENGVTSYRTSQINPLGGLSEDWPRGFLDVGSDEAGKLLRQTVLRQRQISNKKD
jgi:predicted ATPase